MRLAKVKIEFQYVVDMPCPLHTVQYVVDMDNADMVNQVKDALYEDVVSALKYNELFDYIHVTDEDKTLKKEDIPEFLTEEGSIDDIS